jgi:histone-lysine N-methyltransferase SETMAR
MFAYLRDVSSHFDRGSEHGRFSAKFDPRVLTIEQKEYRLSVATNLLQQVEMDQNFMESIITGDETWVYGYDTERKRQSSQGNSPASPRPMETHQARSKVKAILMVFSDMEGIVHYQYFSEGPRENQD